MAAAEDLDLTSLALGTAEFGVGMLTVAPFWPVLVLGLWSETGVLICLILVLVLVHCHVSHYYFLDSDSVVVIRISEFASDSS